MTIQQPMILGTKATTSKSIKDLLELLSVTGTLFNYHLQSLTPAMSILTHELFPPAINGALKLQRYIESLYTVHIIAMSWAIWFLTLARSPPRRITTHSHDDTEVAWQQHLKMLLWDGMLFHPQPTLCANSLLLLSLSIFVKCQQHETDLPLLVHKYVNSTCLNVWIERNVFARS